MVAPGVGATAICRAAHTATQQHTHALPQELIHIDVLVWLCHMVEEATTKTAAQWIAERCDLELPPGVQMDWHIPPGVQVDWPLIEFANRALQEELAHRITMAASAEAAAAGVTTERTASSRAVPSASANASPSRNTSGQRSGRGMGAPRGAEINTASINTPTY